MITLKEIQQTAKTDDKFIAIGDNGKKYEAHFSKEYLNGVMFFCSPAEVKILGYEPIEQRTLSYTGNGT